MLALGGFGLNAANAPTVEIRTETTDNPEVNHGEHFLNPLELLDLAPDVDMAQANSADILPVEVLAESDLGVAAEAGAPAVRLNPPSPEATEKPESPARAFLRMEVDATYNARQCIIDRESRKAGQYIAEFRPPPGQKDNSTASGAYQWTDGSWQFYVPAAEKFYGIRLTSPIEDKAGGRLHAAFASPYVQDLVTAFALLHKNLAQNQEPWPYRECWNLVHTPKRQRAEALEFGPTDFIAGQIDV